MGFLRRIRMWWKLRKIEKAIEKVQPSRFFALEQSVKFREFNENDCYNKAQYHVGAWRNQDDNRLPKPSSTKNLNNL